MCACVCLSLSVCVCTSERVGWVPTETEVPEAVKSTYKWIEGLSVTEMEIMHGAYRKDNSNGTLCCYCHCDTYTSCCLPTCESEITFPVIRCDRLAVAEPVGAELALLVAHLSTAGLVFVSIY